MTVSLFFFETLCVAIFLAPVICPSSCNLSPVDDMSTATSTSSVSFQQPVATGAEATRPDKMRRETETVLGLWSPMS